MKPTTVVTMGDPSGVGPEICVRAFEEEQIYNIMRPILVGNIDVISNMLILLDSKLVINQITNINDARNSFGIIDVINIELENKEAIEYGVMSKYGTTLAYNSIMKAIELGKKGLADVITTAPINKLSFEKAGYKEVSHTDIMNREFSGYKTLSMFSCVGVRVFHLTRHMSLMNAIKSLTIEKTAQKLEDIYYALIDLEINNPRIGLAALNPHASDDGMFGKEENDILIPAVNLCRAKGINVIGPVPADVIFHQGFNGNYDGILSLYHDQGHIACKTFNFNQSVSATLGLPFMRTTVDHGTAYDIAGKGIASHENIVASMVVGTQYWKMKYKEEK